MSFFSFQNYQPSRKPLGSLSGLRRRMAQLPSHVSIWLQNEWVGMEAQYDYHVHWLLAYDGNDVRPQNCSSRIDQEENREDGRWTLSFERARRRGLKTWRLCMDFIQETCLSSLHTPSSFLFWSSQPYNNHQYLLVLALLALLSTNNLIFWLHQIQQFYLGFFNF